MDVFFVGGELEGEGYGVVEMLDVADAGEEFDTDSLAVEVAVEVEDVDFEGALGLAEGGLGTEVGHGDV